MKSKRKPTPSTLAPDTLDLLEQVLGARLPPAYRDWLANHNGQMTENRLVTFVENGRETATTLHSLYAVNSEHAFNDLWHYHANYGAELRPWYLSIGADDGGNQFVLALKGPNHGQVFSRDHEVALDVGLHPVAPSFAAFMAGLEKG